MNKMYMKAALFIATLSVAAGASANTTIIAPPDGTISVIKAGEGAENYAITNPASSNDIAITKKGSVMLLGGTSLTEAAISSSDGNVTLDIEEPLSADFDTVESTYITAHSIKTDNGNKYAAATADKNVKIDMSGYAVTSGEITLQFDMFLAEPKKTNLFTIYDDYGEKIFEVQLRFRRDTEVYVAHTKANDKYNYTPLRDKLLPVDEWVNIEAVIDIDNSKVSLYCDSTEIFSAKPMLDDAVPSSLSVGTGADNIAVYSGRKLKDAQLRIDTESLSLTNGYDFVSSTLSASVKLFDEYEGIDSKYLYWSADDNSFCNVSPDGILTADISALTASKTVNVYSAFSCGAETVSAQEAITVSAGGSDGQAADTQKCALTAALSKTSSIAAGDTITVDAVVYNPTATPQTYYVVVPLSDTNGKNIQNHVFKIESAESSGRESHSFNFDVASGTSLSAQVFVFDKDFKVNVLR